MAFSRLASIRWQQGSARHSLRFKSASPTTSTTEAATPTTGVPVIQSLIAASFGIATVSLAAAAVEYGTASSVPPYDPKTQRFDQSSFVGRFSRMLLACDPRLLVYSNDQVRHYKTMIDKYQDYDSSSALDARTLYEARRIVEASLHPDTGDVLPRPFRMSGYVPFNGPICVAMVASQSTAPLLFWSWLNQSQNALVNFYNRNASSPMSNETLALSYAAAVGSSLIVAFGLSTLIQKKYSPVQAKAMMRWVAFPSAIVASSLNCYIVRSPEIESGIPLMDENGQDVAPGETSNIAAAQGVYSTTASRAILQAPVYFLPPLLLLLGPLKRYLSKHPTMHVPVTTYLLLCAFGLGLPATVAIFPQISEIPAVSVEDRFRHLRNPKTNQPYPVFYYNKGL